jgi:hypothetical protein
MRMEPKLSHQSVPLYYVVVGNRDQIKYQNKREPFWKFLDKTPAGFLSSLAYLPCPFGLPDSPLIGDCGAWSYKTEAQPKLKKDLVTPEWALEQYQKHFKQGDRVVAPDHMLIPFEGVDLNARRKFNIESAKKFLPIATAAGFKPMATVHGMDLEERLKNIEQLYEIGYHNFSLGGLAARASQKKVLIESVTAVVEKIRGILPDAWVHVLGVSSPDYAASWAKIGVNSYDGSSHFKEAFTAGTFFAVEDGRLVKHKATRVDRSTGKLLTPIEAPECNCLACSKLREEGIDTRTYGSNENNMGRAAHNLNMLMRAQANAISAAQVITLVSCVGKKRSEASLAKDLYQSPWFTKAHKYVESQNSNWYIISAKYGLVHRDKVIDPYEQTLNDMPASERRSWASEVFEQILKELPNGGQIQIFAGERYREFLIPLLTNAGYKTNVPLEGLGIGQQLAWFDSHLHT